MPGTEWRGAAELGRQRALQSLSTSDGLVVLIEPDRDHAALAVLGSHLSGVRLSDGSSVAGTIEAEAMPGSIGFVCERASMSTADARAAGASGCVIRYGADAADALATHVQELHVLGLAALVQIDAPGFGGADLTDWLVEAVGRASAADPDLVIVPFPVDESIDDLARWSEACARVDEASGAPWLLATGAAPFHLGLRQVRTAAFAGSSGCVLGVALFDELNQPASGGAEAEDHTPSDDTLARGLQLVAAQRRALAAWDALSSEDDAAPGPRWFGVRTFVQHPDVSRLEERVVVHRADSPTEALALGQAEAEEYAASFDAEAVDAVQVYEIALYDFVSAVGSGLVGGAEVYSQMRPVGENPDAVLDAYFD